MRFSKNFGETRCFSNFYPCTIKYDGRTYMCSEAAWQSMKVTSPTIRNTFSKLNGSKSKSKGRQCALRADWEDVKYDLMVDVLKAKFTQNPELFKILLSTGDQEIIEDTTAWHDNLWGDCRCDRCKNIKGKNLLGKALMEVRDFLKNEN